MMDDGYECAVRELQKQLNEYHVELPQQPLQPFRRFEADFQSECISRNAPFKPEFSDKQWNSLDQETKHEYRKLFERDFLLFEQLQSIYTQVNENPKKTNSYLVFQAEQSKLLQHLDNITKTQIIASRWKELTKDEKIEYEQKVTAARPLQKSLLVEEFNILKTRYEKQTAEKPTKLEFIDRDDQVKDEIDMIIGIKRIAGKKQYLVRWKGKSGKDATWVPKKQLKKVKEMVKFFEETYYKQQFQDAELSSGFSSTPVVKEDIILTEMEPVVTKTKKAAPVKPKQTDKLGSKRKAKQTLDEVIEEQKDDEISESIQVAKQGRRKPKIKPKQVVNVDDNINKRNKRTQKLDKLEEVIKVEVNIPEQKVQQNTRTRQKPETTKVDAPQPSAVLEALQKVIPKVVTTKVKQPKKEKEIKAIPKDVPKEINQTKENPLAVKEAKINNRQNSKSRKQLSQSPSKQVETKPIKRKGKSQQKSVDLPKQLTTQTATTTRQSRTRAKSQQIEEKTTAVRAKSLPAKPINKAESKLKQAKVTRKQSQPKVQAREKIVQIDKIPKKQNVKNVNTKVVNTKAKKTTPKVLKSKTKPQKIKKTNTKVQPIKISKKIKKQATPQKKSKKSKEILPGRPVQILKTRNQISKAGIFVAKKKRK